MWTGSSALGRLQRLNQARTISVLTVVIVLSWGSVALYLSAWDVYSETQIWRLIEPAYNSQRPGGGRLSGAAYSPIPDRADNRLDLGRAQLLLLRYADVEVRQRLQGLVHLASGDWKRFANDFSSSHDRSEDAATLNNVGASFLALADDDPTFLIKALDHFERASQRDPTAPEPLFNLIVTFRKLGLPIEEIQDRYEALDSRSPWYFELKSNITSDESVVFDGMRRAIDNGDFATAETLFERNSGLARTLAMRYAMSNSEDSPTLVRFIASQIERRYGDKTVSAALAPLFTEKRALIVAMRIFVTQGAQFYAQGNFKGSAEAYAKAQELQTESGSVFDELWIDLNRVDTDVRLGEFDVARNSLERLVAAARENGFTWLEAKALAIYGSTLRLTSSYAELMNVVEKADRLFVAIHAPADRVRPLFYLSYYRYAAGDIDEAFRLAVRCRQLTQDTDHSRISSLTWLMGTILYRRGLPTKAVLFSKESVNESQKIPNSGAVALMASTTSQLYQSMSEEKLSEKYLDIAETAFKSMREGFDRTQTELLLGIVKATLELNRRQYGVAETLLERNLDLYSQQPFKVTPYLSGSLMLLARTYSATGRISEAAEKFNEAIEVVEGDDQYLQSEKLRVTFDDSRRDLYESAIAFEHNNGSSDGAWTYLQKYRAKLFLEFLGQFNPEIEETRGQLERPLVQKLLPADTQIIEYLLLKDRILIWLVTDKLFTVRTVQISRSEVEEKVQQALQSIRTKENADILLTDLGKLLIEPVAALLDPKRTIAIIPDRALQGLPFSALRRPNGNRYLVQDFPIAVSPSLTHLLAADSKRQKRDAIVGFGSKNGASSELKELDALGRIYANSTTVAGGAVDKAGFLKAMKDAAVFHYAGHSATDAVDPLRSSILLDGDRYGVNSVTAVDISRQRLATNSVIILSSCDSSVGNSRDGVGIRGLTSAFLIGGAGSVVGSLWRVEAASTAELMIKFHRSFASSQIPVAKALREAQVQFLESFPEQSHPYYWSGFVVTGNLSALR